MLLKPLTKEDILFYLNDIYSCYKCNHLIFDCQNYFSDLTIGKLKTYIDSFANGEDSLIYGIFDDSISFLYGLIIFDNMRFAENKSSAEVHIVVDKMLWGKQILNIFKNVISRFPFTTYYCMIPAIATNAIRLCKKLGFKKTGYIPEVLPYINSKGEQRMYDIQIWSFIND